MKENKKVFLYIFFDYLSASLSWTLFFLFRKVFIESKLYNKHIPDNIFDINFVFGIALVPIFWIFLYIITGTYIEVYRKYRLKELWQTFIIILFGVLIIFLKLIIDDVITTYSDYYKSIFALITIHFTLTYIPRVVLTTRTINKIRSGRLYFKTIIVGINGEIEKVYNELSKVQNIAGNKVIGYVSINNIDIKNVNKNIPRIGDFEDLTRVILDNSIDEVFIAIESNHQQELQTILNKLLLTNVKIKLLPTLFDLAYGYSKINTQFDSLFVEINNSYLTPTQESLKRIIDISISTIAAIVLLPIYIILAIAVKISSKGPVFYLQERIGKNMKPFKIIKFRTMFIDAEKFGPQLSSKHDPRITKLGRFLRKTRLDEIPQFFNVIIGNMSLVGPRPERQFYIDQIAQKAPYYYSLLKVKPGITSLGQVKYGYAENVDQMLERLRYDLAYLRNISIYLDFRIMIMTVKTIFEASGK